MRTWLLELAGAAALAIAGITLWALPSTTPVVGHPPMGYGWACLGVAAVLTALSTTNFLGLEFQLPLRRRQHSGLAAPSPTLSSAPAPGVPVEQPALAAPVPVVPELVRPQRGQGRDFTDSTPQDLIKLAKTPDLTRFQIARLIDPYKTKWLAIEGIVTDVGGSDSWAGIDLKMVNGDDNVTAKAYFNKKDGAAGYERASALHRGARVRIQGKIDSVQGYGYIALDPAEFID